MHQSLYQINTKALLSTLGPRATIDSIPNSLLDSLAAKGIDWVWLLGVWAIGPTGREISLSHKEWHREYKRALPDLEERDICGSPFAVASYSVEHTLGGEAALARFRERLEQRGINLLLDFVPNHIGFDHPWVKSRPDFLIEGTEEDLKAHPDCWARVGNSIFANGRDPHYPGWPDTLQLNFFNPQLRAAIIGELRSVAARCRGVRCDMAMLLEPEVFHRTWSGRDAYDGDFWRPFWPEAIQSVKRDTPDFMFLAEVYWGYEGKLQEHGFAYTYDKTLYDRLLHREPQGVLSHLKAPQSFLCRTAHFLENHDEPRIASKVSPDEQRAAATVSFLAPGLRFFHHGEWEGMKVRIPVHLNRGPVEVSDETIEQMYDILIPIVNSPAGKNGTWHLLEPGEAWATNPTHLNFLAYYITHESGDLFVVVNYADYQGQCFITIPTGITIPNSVVLHDQFSDATYTREAADLQSRGMYFDVAGFTTHIFSVRSA